MGADGHATERFVDRASTRIVDDRDDLPPPLNSPRRSFRVGALAWQHLGRHCDCWRSHGNNGGDVVVVAKRRVGLE